ncbi:MAG: coproporphyrinogen dehydrogenase HemZ [Eubacterium sp.]|nr:coproporphyrinogen dehydrogenase HemZ [Eubacterium sp.]
MILLVENDTSYTNDLRAMLQAFFSGEKITGVQPAQVADYDKELFKEFRFLFTALFMEKHSKLRLEENGKVVFTAYINGDYTDKTHFRNKLKLASYRLLSEYTGRELPWGSLTGMRPTKIATKALNDGLMRDEIIDGYMDVYMTSEEKASLAVDVAEREREILSSVDPWTDYCLYIGIPFCPTRCLYCSFTSYPIEMYRTSVSDYLDCLIRELQIISYINRKRRLISIYIGGGTPTSLDAGFLEELLSAVDGNFDLSHLREYTVEAGRPDSLDRDKLKVLEKHHVSRISVNPQTMRDSTLRLIGRAHTSDDTMRAFRMAREMGDYHINMDIIAGLPGETADDMRYTLGVIEKLQPDSLTVHSLAVKRASELRNQPELIKATPQKDMDRMLRLADASARKMGLTPYYLYRQKNISGNLENVGYAKKPCLYNVLIIEEKLDIFAAGAGSVTRVLRMDPETRETTGIDRAEDVRNVDQYMQRIEDMIERKRTAVEREMRF